MLRKVISLVSALVFATVMTASSIAVNADTDNEITTDNKTISIGDVNSDGKIDVVDIVTVAAHIKGIKPLENPILGDVDFDGKLTIADVVTIAAHVKGIKPLPAITISDDEMDSSDSNTSDEESTEDIISNNSQSEESIVDNNETDDSESDTSDDTSSMASESDVPSKPDMTNSSDNSNESDESSETSSEPKIERFVYKTIDHPEEINEYQEVRYLYAGAFFWTYDRRRYPDKATSADPYFVSNYQAHRSGWEELTEDINYNTLDVDYTVDELKAAYERGDLKFHMDIAGVNVPETDPYELCARIAYESLVARGEEDMSIEDGKWWINWGIEKYSDDRPGYEGFGEFMGMYNAINYFSYICSIPDIAEITETHRDIIAPAYTEILRVGAIYTDSSYVEYEKPVTVDDVFKEMCWIIINQDAIVDANDPIFAKILEENPGELEFFNEWHPGHIRYY